jgi:hypothetical protein
VSPVLQAQATINNPACSAAFPRDSGKAISQALCALLQMDPRSGHNAELSSNFSDLRNFSKGTFKLSQEISAALKQVQVFFFKFLKTIVFSFRIFFS